MRLGLELGSGIHFWPPDDTDSEGGHAAETEPKDRETSQLASHPTDAIPVYGELE